MTRKTDSTPGKPVARMRQSQQINAHVLYFSFAIIALYASAPVCAAEVPPIDAEIQRANRLIAAGRFSEALALVEQSKADKIRNPEWRFVDLKVSLALSWKYSGEAYLKSEALHYSGWLAGALNNLKQAGADDNFLRDAPPVLQEFTEEASEKATKAPELMVQVLKYARRATKVALELEQEQRDGAYGKAASMRLWVHLNMYLSHRWISGLYHKLPNAEVERSGLKLALESANSNPDRYCQTLRDLVTKFDTIDRNDRAACIETCYLYASSIGRLTQGSFGVSYARLATFNLRQIIPSSTVQPDLNDLQTKTPVAIPREMISLIKSEPERILDPISILLMEKPPKVAPRDSEIALGLGIRQRVESDGGVSSFKRMIDKGPLKTNGLLQLELARSILLIQGDAVGAVREIELALSRREVSRPMPSTLGVSLRRQFMSTPYMFEFGRYAMLTLKPIFSFLEQQRSEQLAKNLDHESTTRTMLRLADMLTQSDYFLDREVGVVEAAKAAGRLLESSSSDEQKIQLTLFLERLNQARRELPEFSQGLIFTRAGVRGVGRSNGAVIRESCIIINPDGGFIYGVRK